MDKQTSDCVNSSKTNRSDGSKRDRLFSGRVGKDDRREEVLRFLVEEDMALPPLAIFGGLKRHHEITFEYRTVQTALKELVDSGDLIRIDTKKLRQDANIVPVEDAGSRRAYYFPTKEGRQRVNKSSDGDT